MIRTNKAAEGLRVTSESRAACPAKPELKSSGRAQKIALLGTAVSPEARALVDHLFETVVVPANTLVTPEGELRPPRGTSAAKMRLAIGALLADLFDLQSEGVRGRAVPSGLHGLSPGSLSSKALGFGRNMFLAAIKPIENAGLIQIDVGKPNWTHRFGVTRNVGGSSTAFRLTPETVTLAAAHGVSVSDWAIHWRRTNGKHPMAPTATPRLVLRTKRKRVNGIKQAALDCAIDYDDPAVSTTLEALGKLNDYLGRQTIDGIAFPGLRRIFNNGDQPDFDWNKGGRYYSLPGGHSYEVWNADKRRETITINGEAVDEVDLRASHLTLLHALLEKPFDAHQDPYSIPDWPRAVVKAWMSQAIGASNPRPVQWSIKSQADFEAERPGQFLDDQFPIREVGAAVKARHPLLIQLRGCGLGTLDLQFHEAEILRLAMEDLMLRQDIPVLPMHDAIITPRSMLGAAREALESAFSRYVEGFTGHPTLAKQKVTVKDPIEPVGA